MVRDINFDITADDKTRRPTDTAANNFERLQRRVDQTNTKKPSREVEEFAKLIDRSMRDGESAFTSIQRSIDDTKTHITKLRTEFRTTGSSSIFGDLKSAQNDLRKLESVFKELAPAAVAGGESAAQQFMSEFGSAGKILASPTGLVIVGALAPVIGAGVAAAVTAGVGLGLIGAAAFIQKDNPAIKTAFGSLRDDAISVFKEATTPMVQPFVDAIGYADQLVAKEGPQLHKIFADLAPAVDPLVKDFGALASDILPGIDSTVQAFTKATKDPAVTASVDRVGEAFGSLFTEIGNNPQLIEHTFETVNAIVADATKTLERFVQVAEFVDKLRTVGDQQANANAASFKPAGTPVDPHAATKIVQVSRAQEAAAKAAGNFTSDAQQAADALSSSVQALTGNVTTSIGPTYGSAAAFDALYKSMTGAFNVAMNLDQANLGAKQGLADLRTAIKNNGKAWSENTQAGRDNWRQLLTSIGADKDAYDAQVAASGATKEASDKYHDQVGALLGLAGQAGLSKSAIKKLRDEYDSIKPTKTITVHVKVVESQNDATLLGRITGQRIASAEMGANWMPAGPDRGGAGDNGSQGRNITPAVQVDSTLHNNIYLDGSLIDQRLARSRSFEQHRNRVGVLR